MSERRDILLLMGASLMDFKWLRIPFSNETKEIKVAQTWEVRWQSRYGEYSGSVRPELESFLTEKEANDFAESLRAAYKLLRHTSGTEVSVAKAR